MIRQVLRASAAMVVAASPATSSAVATIARAAGYIFELDVTAAATDVGDTLDVKVQTTIDGTNWIDICYFTQVLGNGGALRHVGKVLANQTQAMFAGGTALTAGNVRHIIGTSLRTVSTLVDANSNGGFTFAVYAIPFSTT